MVAMPLVICDILFYAGTLHCLESVNSTHAPIAINSSITRELSNWKKELKVKKLENIVEEKTKLLKELEIRVNAMEC